MAETIKNLLVRYTELQEDKREIEDAIHLIREESSYKGVERHIGNNSAPSIKALIKELNIIKMQLSQIENMRVVEDKKEGIELWVKNL